MVVKKGIQKQDGKNLEEMLRNMAAQNGGTANLSVLPGGTVKIDFPGSTSQIVPDNGMLHRAYASRTVKGDSNDKSKVEALQCGRCQKWIPVAAMLDFDNGVRGIKALECPIGRTGKGGIHLLDLGGDPDNPSLTTTMMPISQVEPYTSQKQSSSSGEPKNVPDAPVITAENFDEEIKKLKELLEKKKGGSTVK